MCSFMPSILCLPYFFLLQIFFVRALAPEDYVDCQEIINEPAHDKIYNKTCVNSKDSDQPVHPPSMARFLVYPSLDGLETVEGTCGQ